MQPRGHLLSLCVCVCVQKVIGSGVRKELLEAGWVKPPPNFSEFKTKRSRGPIRACCLRLYHVSNPTYRLVASNHGHLTSISSKNV